jgi:hypothetical protein
VLVVIEAVVDELVSVVVMVMGQTVVLIAMVSVMTYGVPGHLVTDGGHEVRVWTVVV